MARAIGDQHVEEEIYSDAHHRVDYEQVENDLAAQLEHHNKLIAHREAKFQCVVTSRLKVERKFEELEVTKGKRQGCARPCSRALLV